MNKNEDERGEGGGVSEKYLEVKLEAEYGERNMLTLFVSAFISDKRNIVYWQTHVRAHWPICETRARRRLLATCALQNALRITRRPISGADIETALSHLSWKKKSFEKAGFVRRPKSLRKSILPPCTPSNIFIFSKIVALHFFAFSHCLYHFVSAVYCWKFASRNLFALQNCWCQTKETARDMKTRLKSDWKEYFWHSPRPRKMFDSSISTLRCK